MAHPRSGQTAGLYSTHPRRIALHDTKGENQPDHRQDREPPFPRERRENGGDGTDAEKATQG